MSSDIKKLLSILDESTTAGSVASVSSKVGESPIKRSKDTIFAAENSEQTECATDTTSSPSNFGLWKNSASLSTEQRNKHGRKHSTVDRSVMYPQLGESSQWKQSVIDSRTSAAKRSERGETGVDPTPKNEWYIMINGSSEKGKKKYPSRQAAEKRSDDIRVFYKSKGWKLPRVEIIQRLGESYNEPKDKNDDKEPFDYEEWKKSTVKPRQPRGHKDAAALGKAIDSEQSELRKGKKKDKNDDNEPFDYKKWKKSTVKPRRPRGWEDAAALGKAIDSEQSELRKLEEQGVAEGKKPDRYHIVNKDGKPASLASYADRESAVKDRDEKHPGAVVQQVGPRGKVKGVAEGSEITEEMIADRLKNELKLFKSGANKSISGKPADREVQPKKSTKKASDEDK